MPSPPDASFHPPLYFRILPLSASALRLELWELGRPYGARSVSAIGTENLKARRIALAAAELARGLRRRRLAEIEDRARLEAAGQDAIHRENGIPIYAHFAFEAGAEVATIGIDDAWLLGPRLAATLAWSSGQRLSLGAAYLAGDANRSTRWLEGAVSLGQSLALSRSFALEVGAEAAIASVRFAGVNDGAPFDTWSSRAGAFVRIDARLARHVGVWLGPDVGAVLRPLSWSNLESDAHGFGGLWLGARLGITLDPQAQ